MKEKQKQLAQPKPGNGKRFRMGDPLTDMNRARVVKLPFARITLHDLPALKIGPEDLESDRWVTRTNHRIARMINEDFSNIGEYVAALMGEFERAERCVVYVEPRKMFKNGSTSLLEHRLTVTRSGDVFNIDDSGKGSYLESDMFLKALLDKAFEERRPMILDYKSRLKIEFDDCDMNNDSCHIYPVDKGKGTLALMPFYYREPSNPSGIVMLQGDLACKNSRLEGVRRAYWNAKTAMVCAAQISNQLTQKYDAITVLPKIVDFEVDFKGSIRGLVDNKLEGLYLGMLDSDNFKRVNDTYGYATGNILLRRVAETIKDSIRLDDRAQRLGGDEFGIILRNISSRKEAEMIMERLREKIAEIKIYAANGDELRVTCSIGVCDVASIVQGVLSSGNAVDENVLEMISDMAFNSSNDLLKIAKREGKNQTRFATDGFSTMSSSPPPA
jgi:diguanylate cyclase (GGDEF)-like protein